MSVDVAPQELAIWWAPIPGTAQEAFFDDDTPEAALLFTGGVGSGKSTTLWAKMLKLSAINHPLPIVWLVPDYDHVWQTLLPILQDEVGDGQPLFLRPDQFHYHQTKHILQWAGGGEIWFLSADRPDEIAGPNVAAAGVDEPSRVDRVAWRNTSNRVRHVRSKLRQTVAAGTPEDLSWMGDLFFDPERPDRYKVFRMATRENVELLKAHPDYLAQVAENATDAEIAVFLEGKGQALTGAAAYPTFDDALHWNANVPGPDPAQPLCLSFDFNVNPMVCIVAQIRTGTSGPELHVVDAVVLYGGSTVDQTCDVLLKRYPSWPAGVVIYGDATGRNRTVTNLRGNYALIEDRLTVMGPLTNKVPLSNPAVSSRLGAVNRLLKNALGVTRLWIRKTLPAKQSPTRELVRSIQRTRKKDGTDDIEKPAGETHTHAADALGYLAVAEWPIVKPVVTFGRVRVEQFL